MANKEKQQQPEKKQTKLRAILDAREITYEALQKMILHKFPGYKLGIDRISRFCTGKSSNVHLQVAVKIAKALDVKLDDIVDEM